MGASGWDYRVSYAGSVEATLIAVQEQVLADGDYIWPWETIARYGGGEVAVPRPTSLDTLNAAKETEEFWDEGTHTILDTDRIVTSTDDDADDVGDGAIRPLSPAELARVFGTEQPSAADFDRVVEPETSSVLDDLTGPRWTGRSLVIYRDGTPDEVYFWGFSGD